MAETPQGGTVLSICVCCLGFVSDFGFRVSDLEDRLPVVLFSNAIRYGLGCFQLA